MKKLLLIACVLALAGCMKNEYKAISYPVLPDGLKDCQFFRVASAEGDSMQVTRCPNSTTTTATRQGKSGTSTVVVVDGIEYIKKE